MEIDLVRLCKSLDNSRYMMEPFRQERYRVVSRIAGGRYHPNAADKRTYVNLLDLYVDVVGRNLISKNPRCMLSTFESFQKATVDAMEHWLNKEFENIDFANIMQRCVLDGFCSMGIAYVALASTMDAVMKGDEYYAGKPCVRVIDQDDFVFDHRCKDIRDAEYIGHRYRVPLAMAKANTKFNKSARDRLSSAVNPDVNREGDKRIGTISGGSRGFDDDYEEMVDLWQVWVRRADKIVTISEDDLSGPSGVWNNGKPEALRIQKWVGPDGGPYNILAYRLVPGQAFPKGPLQNVVDLDIAFNEAYRKLVREAANLKTVTLVQRDVSEDGDRLAATNDGGVCAVGNPGAIAEITMNGPNQGLFLFMREMFERFSIMSGNLMSLGGLAPQAGTLGAEQQLLSQSGGQIASMQDTTKAFVSDVADSLLWYHWNDPRSVQRVKLEGIEGVDLTQEIYPWDHEDPEALKREGEMPEMSIDPYSMRNQTPQERATAIQTIITQVYAPLAQIALQQGVTLDFNKFMAMMAKYLDQPDIQQLFTITETPTPQEPPGMEDDGTMPNSTKREYVRRSLGGDSSAAKNENMDSQLESGMASGSMNGESNGKLSKV